MDEGNKLLAVKARLDAEKAKDIEQIRAHVPQLANVSAGVIQLLWEAYSESKSANWLMLDTPEEQLDWFEEFLEKPDSHR